MTDSEQTEEEKDLEAQFVDDTTEGDLDVEGAAAPGDVTGETATPDLSGEETDADGGSEAPEPGEDLQDLGSLPEGVPSLPGDFKENWALLSCCVSLFIACMWLPIEGGVLDLYAKDSIAGGFLAVFAGYGIIGCLFNILHRKMIVVPAVMAGFDGLYVSIRRLAQLIQQMPENATGQDYVRMAGPGLWIILGCSLWIFVTLFKSASSGRAREQDRREASRVAKAASRREKSAL